MKIRGLLLTALLGLAAGTALGQSGTVFIDYLASGYKFQIVKSNDPTIAKFQVPSFNDAAWSTGRAAFGTLNNTSSPPCPLNDTAHVRSCGPPPATSWRECTSRFRPEPGT